MESAIVILVIVALLVSIRVSVWAVEWLFKVLASIVIPQKQNSQPSLAAVQAEPSIKVTTTVQRTDFRTAAKAFRDEEIKRLSKVWLSNAETYRELSPQQFENAISELFRLLGYEVEQTPFSNDWGKDAIARKDGRKYLIECKKYAETRSVGRRDLQILVAAMQDEKADGGFYINTGVFAKTAKDYAKCHGIQLYDWSRLPGLVNKAYPVRGDLAKANTMCTECGSIFSVTLGDTPTTTACPNGHPATNDIVRADLGIVSSIDTPYCKVCGSVMRVVDWNRRRFWGCPRYPKCTYTRPMLRHERVQLKIEQHEDEFLPD